MSAVTLIGMESLVDDKLIAGMSHGGFAPLLVSWASAEASALLHEPRAVVAAGWPNLSVAVTFCSHLRANGYRGVVFVVMRVAATHEIVRSLDAGADDCLVVPIHGDVLAARLRAAFRMSQRSIAPTPEVGISLLPADSAKVAKIGQRHMRLTPVEGRLLRALLDANGCLVATESLKAVASPEVVLSRASLHVHMVHLRTKLGVDAWRIQNCRSVGYRFVPIAVAAAESGRAAGQEI